MRLYRRDLKRVYIAEVINKKDNEGILKKEYGKKKCIKINIQSYKGNKNSYSETKLAESGEYINSCYIGYTKDTEIKAGQAIFEQEEDSKPKYKVIGKGKWKSYEAIILK